MNIPSFSELAACGYNRIPVVREILADLETPLSSYLKLARGPYSYLFESVQGGERWGRYSIIGLPCRQVLKVYGHEVRLYRDDQLVSAETVDDPLQYVAQFQQRFKAPEIAELPRFNGGLVGYFGYDCVRYVEPKLAASCPEDELGTPDILLMVSDEVLVFDNLAGKLIFMVHVDPGEPGAKDAAESRIDKLVDELSQPLPKLGPIHVGDDKAAESQFVSRFGEQQFKQSVNKIKEYILAGDCMQVVPSQRLSAPFTAEPVNLYRALRSLNPSPYMYFLDLGDFQVAGSSPEILARLEGGSVTVRPIAGTRRRGRSAEEDMALEEEMLADPKEVAEHLMLIDLGRNDVGRVAEIGTVEVTEKMVVERYSHVMHITSNVIGKIRPGMQAIDVLRASLPAGTLSGAPKIRAMEIIDEVEPVKRGIYGGAIGYISWQGNMDTAIAIRTAVIKDGQLHVQAGAGVVADSVPELEWKETMNKARVMIRALDMVQQSEKVKTP